MFEDPMITLAALAAIYLVGCVASFFVGRAYERHRRGSASLFQIAADNARRRRPFVHHTPGVHTGPPPAFNRDRPFFQR